MPKEGYQWGTAIQELVDLEWKSLPEIAEALSPFWPKIDKHFSVEQLGLNTLSGEEIRKDITTYCAFYVVMKAKDGRQIEIYTEHFRAWQAYIAERAPTKELVFEKIEGGGYECREELSWYTPLNMQWLLRLDFLKTLSEIGDIQKAVAWLQNEIDYPRKEEYMVTTGELARMTSTPLRTVQYRIDKAIERKEIESIEIAGRTKLFELEEGVRIATTSLPRGGNMRPNAKSP